MPTLATLTQQLEALCDEIDSVDGAIPEDILERFTSLQATHQEKCAAYVAVIGSLQHNAAYYSARSELLKRRAKTCERVEKAIKDKLVWQLTNNPNIPYVSPDGDKIRLANSPESLELKVKTSSRSISRVIDYFDDIPLEFIDVVTLRTLNTDKVKQYLKDGNKLDWAELKTNKHIRIT